MLRAAPGPGSGMSATERLAEADRILNLPTAREYVAAMLLELADARAVRAEADQRDARTVTEWAIWFDADDPNDPNADIFGKVDEAEARDALIGWESYSDPDDLDQPSGACFRTVTTVTSSWLPVSPGDQTPETKD